LNYSARKKATAGSIRAAQRILLEEMGKERLHEILCSSGSVTAMAQESVEQWPIGFAKS
jgi:hypothetical protein